MKRYFLHKTKRQKYLLALGDLAVLFLSFLITYIINFAFFARRSYTVSSILGRIFLWAGVFSILSILIFYFSDLYVINKLKNFFRSSILIGLSILFASLITSGILFFFPKYIIGRKVIVINIPVAICFLVLWRFIFIHKIVMKGKPLRLALIGNKKIISNFIREFSKLKLSRFKITQVHLLEKRDEGNEALPKSIDICKSINELLENPRFDTLIFDHTQASLSDDEIRRILQLKYQDKSIGDFPSFYEEITGKVPLSFVNGEWLMSSNGFHGEVKKSYKEIKRIIDIIFSIFILILTFPLFILISLAIKLDSKGSVFYLQERLGIRKRPFTCYKFRTMEMQAENETGPVWSSKNDPRITRVGKLLRQIRLDELPQLWNVLKGDMSFVGNRPIRKYFADQLSEQIPFYDLRFLIKPGLSGWAQVNHGYSGSSEEQIEKFQYELFYIKNMSLFLDLFIIFKTAKTVLQKGGE